MAYSGQTSPGLGVWVAGLRLRSPVMNASGVLAWSLDEASSLERAGAGAYVAKSATPKPRKGHPRARLYLLGGESVLNAVGIANPGVEEVARALATIKKSLGIPVVASIAASKPEEWVWAAGVLEESGVDAIELNLSCPHFEGGGMEIGQDAKLSAAITREVASTTRTPVIAKLGLFDDLPGKASRLLEAGARAITLINAVRAMRIDVYTGRPVLGNRVGGLSGRYIHPLAVRAVYEVYSETGAEIIGAGGVYTWEDAVELMMAGARAVQVGSAIISRGVGVVGEIVEGIRRYLWIQGYGGVEEIIGAAHRA